TPYIVTFKLWDWDRLGLDGLPRPIHIEDGAKNIQWDRTTQWVKDNLVNNIQIIHEEDDYLEERTGLHELEFIETRRFTSSKKTYHHCEDGVHMLNLVEGTQAVVESPTDAFEPFIVHYAETFILPSEAKEYTIRPYDSEETIRFVKAYVRQ
ncbi:MAG: mannose-6-phosphate isomerase, partial [Coprobacillus cateniformis]